MKVRVVLTVDVDPDLWAFTYGVERSEVRADVRSYIEGWCTEMPGPGKAIRNVTAIIGQVAR